MRGFGLTLAKRALLVGAPCTLMLAACAVPPGPSEAGSASASGAAARPGGVVHTGASIASMSAQYARPHAGPVATGASAWVPPAPPPAFVATGPMPAAGPAEPPLLAVANRQPEETPASAAPVDAASLVRPEAAAPGAAPTTAALDPAVRAQGRELFNQFSCGTCHVFTDARASGAIGPSLDRNPRLTKAFAVDVITDGRGAMPAFGGQMSDAEIATLAEYIVGASRQ